MRNNKPGGGTELTIPDKRLISDSIVVSFLQVVPKTEIPGSPGRRNETELSVLVRLALAASSPPVQGDINKEAFLGMKETNRVSRPPVRYTLFHPDS